MRITRKQLRQIIKESLPYASGQPWVDPKAPVGDPVARAEDHLDRELTDDEIEAAMGWEPADPAGDEDFWAGRRDALDGKSLPTGASPDYKAGWEDGKRDRVTEGTARRKLRRIIREALDVNPEEWSSAQAKIDSILGGVADEEREDLSYEAINVLLNEPGMHAWRENKVDKGAIEKELYAADVDPIDVLDALRNQLEKELKGKSRGPEGYHWSDAWVLMLAEDLGLGPMWSNRETEAQWADRKRKEVEAKIDELMKSRMFSNAEPKDKAEAHKIILDAMMSLEGNGGKRMWVEEYMSDEWVRHKDLAEKLGKAAGQSGPGYWLDALVTWSNGGKDYLDWL